MTAESGDLPWPSWLGPVDDLDETPARILLAAADLFSESSPSQVSLRAIAARAGVNYGLIHHYFKTKDAVLAELLRRSSEVGSERLRDAQTADEALAQFLDPEARTGYPKMLAWAMLDGTSPERLVAAAPVISRIAELIAQESGGPSEPAHEMVAIAAVSALLGWRLYQPVLSVYAGVDDRDDAELTAEVFQAVRALVRAWTQQPSIPAARIAGRSETP